MRGTARGKSDLACDTLKGGRPSSLESKIQSVELGLEEGRGNLRGKGK